jgi:hypothetical protein
MRMHACVRHQYYYLPAEAWPDPITCSLSETAQGSKLLPYRDFTAIVVVSDVRCFPVPVLQATTRSARLLGRRE